MEKPINTSTDYNSENKFLAGVLGGTSFDTALGVAYLQNAGIATIAHPISKTPQEQTVLQLHGLKLKSAVYSAVKELMLFGVSIIFIYCTSLSAAVDLIDLRKKFKLPILSPLDIFKDMAGKFNYFSTITANCQSSAFIEKLLVQYNPDCIVTALSNLKLVNDIEYGKSPTEIISDYNLIEQCKIFSKQGYQVLILGCTHFSIFSDILSEKLKAGKIPLDLIDPLPSMITQVIEIKKAFTHAMSVKSQSA